jgi:methanogenic corrinoid protein MtbC1
MFSPLLPLPVSRMLTSGQRWTGRLLSSVFGVSGNEPAPARGAPAFAPADECRATMREVLESHVIPRLLQATRPTAAAAAPAAAAPPACVSVADIEAFARLCAAGDRQARDALVERLQADGLQPQGMLVDLVAPAARHLGQRWEDDTLDFASVTLGLVQMHEFVHALGYGVHDGPQASGAVRRVMLASAPGSQHMLGLFIVSEFFRKAGWQVVLEVSPTRDELCRAVANEWFDLVGLSVALDAQLTDLPTLVGQLRAASCNPQPPIMLGGPVFLQRDLHEAAFGAQAICRDARECMAIATQLVGR